MNKNKYEITIDGNNYVIKTQKSKEETDKIINYLNQEIEEAKRNIKYKNPAMQATLAGLNIADKFFDLKLKYEKLLEESKIPLENYEPLKVEFEDYKKLHSETDEKISFLEQKILNLEKSLQLVNSDKERYKLELDRQNNIVQKSILENEELRERLLEQEKLTLEFEKQLQEELDKN